MHDGGRTAPGDFPGDSRRPQLHHRVHRSFMFGRTETDEGLRPVPLLDLHLQKRKKALKLIVRLAEPEPKVPASAVDRPKSGDSSTPTGAARLT